MMIYDGDERLHGFATAGNTLVAVLSNAGDPGEMYVAKRSDDATFTDFTAVTNFNEAKRAQVNVTYEPIEYTTSGGYTVRGAYIYPADWTFPPAKPMPVVVWQQGGPGGQMYNQWGTSVESPFTMLPAFGIPVFMVNAVGRLSNGATFYTDMADGDNYGQLDILDVKQGVELLINQNVVDPNAVGVTGCSYGGYFTLQSLVEFPDFYAAGNSQCSLNDMMYEYNFGWAPFLAYLIGDSPTSNPVEYVRDSPTYRSSQIKAPLLQFHGTNDFLFFEHITNIHDQVEANGVPSRFFRGEGYGHGIGDVSRGDGSGVKGQSYAFQLQLQWFREHLGAASEVSATDLISSLLRPILNPIAPRPVPSPILGGVSSMTHSIQRLLARMGALALLAVAAALVSTAAPVRADIIDFNPDEDDVPMILEDSEMELLEALSSSSFVYLYSEPSPNGEWAIAWVDGELLSMNLAGGDNVEFLEYPYLFSPGNGSWVDEDTFGYIATQTILGVEPEDPPTYAHHRVLLHLDSGFMDRDELVGLTDMSGFIMSASPDLETLMVVEAVEETVVLSAPRTVTLGESPFDRPADGLDGEDLPDGLPGILGENPLGTYEVLADSVRVVLTDTAGGERRELVELPEETSIGRVAWQSDGSRVAFVTNTMPGWDGDRDRDNTPPGDDLPNLATINVQEALGNVASRGQSVGAGHGGACVQRGRWQRAKDILKHRSHAGPHLEREFQPGRQPRAADHRAPK